MHAAHNSMQRAGIGLLGAFSSVDWGVRKGAADTLLALNRLLGPLLEHAAMPGRPRVPRCIEAISAAKHDRVRPVRDSMAAALSAFQELHDWMRSHPVRSRLLVSSPRRCCEPVELTQSLIQWLAPHLKHSLVCRVGIWWHGGWRVGPLMGSPSQPARRHRPPESATAVPTTPPLRSLVSTTPAARPLRSSARLPHSNGLLPAAEESRTSSRHHRQQRSRTSPMVDAPHPPIATPCCSSTTTCVHSSMLSTKAPQSRGRGSTSRATASASHWCAPQDWQHLYQSCSLFSRSVYHPGRSQGDQHVPRRSRARY